MGKKTLYHPISLNVIRGALEYCGITPGRITQTSVNSSDLRATYRLNLDRLPPELWARPLDYVSDAVQSCFAADITINKVKKIFDRCDGREKYQVTLTAAAQAPFRETEEAMS